LKEPVDHIVRPRLPWRSESDPAITECGYDARQVKTLTRADFFQRVKDMGQQRAALFTCMTCSQTAQRWSTWDEDPRKALEREIAWEAAWRGNNRGQRLRDELVAIASLIEAHTEEFKTLAADIEQRRSWLNRKAKLGL
jgi:hypothetical protein